MTTLYYIVDPMCSWCYGFSPTWRQTIKTLPNAIDIVYVQGGLAPHSHEPMAQGMQYKIQEIWKTIHRQLGTEFNFDFWEKCQPRRSTYLACQACVAARLQEKEYAMVESIQEQYYLRAENPSDRDTLEVAAENIGLDVERFSADLESEKVVALFERDLRQCRVLGVNSFPSLMLNHQNNYFSIPVTYNDHGAILQHITNLLVS